MYTALWHVRINPKRGSYAASSATAAILLVIGLCASTTAAQTLITPGAPSVALRPQALANGVAGRVTYQYGTEFVSIGAAGNAALNPPPEVANDMRGFGDVAYEYRIGRTEITTSQWVAFMNAAMGRVAADRLPWLTTPSAWGAQADPTYHGPGVHYRVVPGRENFGVGDISWRAAAIYCNWLHNNQQATRQSFLSGAYDVSTFGVRGNIFTDQAAHSPDAKFWIPTLSEYMKAAFYDPNQGGAGIPGYWGFNNGTEIQPRYGSPAAGGEANSGFYRSVDGIDATHIPLMSYPGTQSPWGLLDVAGATQEWTETIFVDGTGTKERMFLGSSWASPVDIGSDRLGSIGASFPANEGEFQGFRIAASIPGPSVGSIVCILSGYAIYRRRRT